MCSIGLNKCPINSNYQRAGLYLVVSANIAEILSISRGPVYEFVWISFRTDNLNCFEAS